MKPKFSILLSKKMFTQNKKSQSNLTPDQVIQMLKDGNQRFLQQNHEERDLLEQVKITAKNGQYPHTVILECVDSRVSAEQIFDQGIGDIFNTRVAGNVVDDDVLGSLEFSCKLAGAKLVLVLGHTQCGAVTAACKNVELGHVTSLVNKIKPAVASIQPHVEDITSVEAINAVSKENVFNAIKTIQQKSNILNTMIEEGSIKLIGALYHIENGTVEFFD